jgi:hypothetical protein
MMYPETLSEILVFKTNITDPSGLERLHELLKSNEQILKWNVDVQDIDHVLRIEAEHVHPSTIINLLQSAGFQCEELPD